MQKVVLQLYFHISAYTYGFIEILETNDPFNVTIVGVTSHNITIRWDNPTAEDSFQIEALGIYGNGWAFPMKYKISNSSNEVCILFIC